MFFLTSQKHQKCIAVVFYEVTVLNQEQCTTHVEYCIDKCNHCFVTHPLQNPPAAAPTVCEEGKWGGGERMRMRDS
jgi:hypothetical protein